MRRLLLHVEQ
jgi:hypothetical protein